jgi:TIR domain
MAESHAAADGKLKVFVSYSRQDSSNFTAELVEGLKLVGFTPKLDLHDIAKGEAWEARLGGLIQEADTVVFVISPKAVKSERCQWEVAKTIELSKRLLPVVWINVPEADVPPKLRQLNYTYFSEGKSFTKALGELAEALRQDLDWIREHTRIGELVARWQSRGRPESLLLRGDDLDAARAWVANRKPAAPEITDLQQSFLNASAETETARLSKERQQIEDMRRAQDETTRSKRSNALLRRESQRNWQYFALVVLVVAIVVRCAAR